MYAAVSSFVGVKETLPATETAALIVLIFGSIIAQGDTVVSDI